MLCLLWMSQTRTVSSCDPESRRVPSIDTERHVTMFLKTGGQRHVPVSDQDQCYTPPLMSCWGISVWRVLSLNPDLVLFGFLQSVFHHSQTDLMTGLEPLRFTCNTAHFCMYTRAFIRHLWCYYSSGSEPQPNVVVAALWTHPCPFRTWFPSLSDWKDLSRRRLCSKTQNICWDLATQQKSWAHLPPHPCSLSSTAIKSLISAQIQIRILTWSLRDGIMPRYSWIRLPLKNLHEDLWNNL